MNLIPDEAPTAAIGNLRFTSGGVYADYLVSGPVSYTHLTLPTTERV